MEETSEHRFSGAGNRAEGIIEALLNYITESSEKPVYYAYEPPPGVPRQTGKFAPQAVPIQDGRAFLDELFLDKQGFELVNHETSVNDFYDRDEVQRVYYPRDRPSAERCHQGFESGHFRPSGPLLTDGSARRKRRQRIWQGSA
jgi:hypothetical protein